MHIKAAAILLHFMGNWIYTYTPYFGKTEVKNVFNSKLPAWSKQKTLALIECY